MNEPIEEQDEWAALQRALGGPTDHLSDGMDSESSRGKRTRHSSRVKLMCVMEALKNKRRQVEIAKMFGVSPPLVSIWKKRALEGIVFALTNQTKIPMMPVDAYGMNWGDSEEEGPSEMVSIPQKPVVEVGGDSSGIHPELAKWMEQVENRLSKLAV